MTTSTSGRRVLFLAGAMTAMALAGAQQASDAPKAAATTPATSQSAQKSAKSDAAQPVKTAAAPQKADDSYAKLISDARAAGFKPVMIRGNQMFCRTAKELGSNFPVRTCYDADQVKIKIQEYAEQRNQMEQMHTSGMIMH